MNAERSVDRREWIAAVSAARNCMDRHHDINRSADVPGPAAFAGRHKYGGHP
ncbi:hypothetical protein [Dactylosporangium matsuzakiense]|uniref:hypothetical protein n=1 Tax=Dactylosporangium matsuzakiense TaxID=53360 RepID=UPI0022F2F864|nr:hypothetical protein [Dactylosporangium matsuzakiense]